VIVFSLAQSGSAEVEAEHRKSKAVQRFHRVEDDLVMERSAEHGMRMTNYGRVRRVLRARVEQSFEPTSGTFKEKGADGGVSWHHGSRLHKTAVGLRNLRPRTTRNRYWIRSVV